MSSNPYGPYSSTTPRPNSSSHTIDKYAAAHALSHQGKLQSWADSKLPTSTKDKKSPVKNSIKSPKSHIDIQLKDLLASEKERTAVSRGLKKSQNSTKENTQKSSNSPVKKGLESKKRSIDSNNHPILINNYELSSIDAQRLNQLQTLALQQEFLSQPAYGAEFAEWVSRKVQSTKNADKLRNSENLQQFYNQTEERQRQNSTNDLHNNVWPDPQRFQQQRGEIYSHRQHLEAEGVRKTAKKQLTLSPNKNDVFSNQKRGIPQKSISKNKPETPKGSDAHKSLRVSPRNVDLSSHHQYHHLVGAPTGGSTKMHSNDSHLLKNSFNLDALRGSLDVQNGKRFEFPKTTKNENRPSAFFQEESPVKLKKKKLIKSPAKKKKLSLAPQDLEIAEWLKTAKKSNPNVLHDINSYMQLAMHERMQGGSDPEIRDYAYAQPEKEQYALSTRSAVDRYENGRGPNVQHPTEEDEFQHHQQQQQQIVRSSVKTIYSSLKVQKDQETGAVHKSRLDQSPKTREIVNELLKRTNSKDLIINPNAKFMALRKQVHEKRTKATFKSADWGLPGAQNNQRDFTEDHDYRPEQDVSPERPTKTRGVSGGNTKSMEGAPVKAQLDQILNKTKQILGTYRYRENTWDKEKKALVNEILHLRSVIEHN